MSMTPATQDDLERPPPVEGGTIAGRVTDFEGVPMVGVRVEAAQSGGGDLDLLPTLTDGDGRFLLEGLADGRYDLRFVLGQVRARTLAVPVGTDQLRVRLARPQGILLVVKTADGRRPPDLLHVVLERRTAEGMLREHVGRHLTSRMLLWSIRPGTYTVSVWGGPYVPVEAHGIEVREGSPAPEVQVLLAAEGGEIRGRVVEARGGPASDCLVAWRRVDGDGPWSKPDCSLFADAEGRFAVRGLPRGRYRVSAARQVGAVVDREVEVGVDGVTDVELTLE
jgi:Carboxypeptidase regulatory-like domain